MSQLIVLSAGGTGGHMTPARALAEDLRSRGYDVEILTDKRGLNYASLFDGVKMHALHAGTLGAGIWGKVRGVFNLALGCAEAWRFLKARCPAVVVGFGGYPSVPGVYMAQRLRLPTVVHEQNAIIGRANALLATKAERIALSLPEVTGLEGPERVRTVVTGNPVRAEIAALYTKPYPVVEPDGRLNLLVLGGSLGARIFSDVVPEALCALAPDYKARLHVVQQCRAEDLDEVREAYEAAGIEATLAPFFEDVPAHLAQAHLVVTRSGASTVAEVATAGRPAIFVPYPHHKDQQQKKNADALADAGGAWVMTEDAFTPEVFLRRLETFLQNPASLFEAAEKVRGCAMPDAARKLGNLVTALASGWD